MLIKRGKMKVKINDLLDLNKTIAADLFEDVEYPWEVLSSIKEYIIELGKTLDPNIYEQKGNNIWVAKSAKIGPNVSLNGPLIICEDAEIRQCAFIRGSAIVGKGATVGNSCELKNAILFDNSQTPHFNYIGDSIIGYKSHIGAGGITSNLKSDKSNVVLKDMQTGDKIETGLRKFGAILGDNVEVGCNSVLNPGTVIGRNTNVYPTSCVRGYIPESSIFKSSDNIVKKH